MTSWGEGGTFTIAKLRVQWLIRCRSHPRYTLDVTFLRPDVALAHLVKHVNDGRTGALTFVLVKDDDTWRIALAQTTPVMTS